ncbi:MAG: hypothetical protein WCT49_05740 [Candidatus Paceibacterota bacterium]|nr:hypothetical protein [Candidatus Paceibacterota bacterium]
MLLIILALLVFYLTLELAADPCEHDNVVLHEDDMYFDTIEYWTNPLCGEFKIMDVIKVDREVVCTKCGKTHKETVPYRNLNEFDRRLSFNIEAHIHQ